MFDRDGEQISHAVKRTKTLVGRGDNMFFRRFLVRKVFAVDGGRAVYRRGVDQFFAVPLHGVYGSVDLFLFQAGAVVVAAEARALAAEFPFVVFRAGFRVFPIAADVVAFEKTRVFPVEYAEFLTKEKS